MTVRRILAATATATAAALALTLTACGSGEPSVSVSEGPVAESTPAAGEQVPLEQFAAALKLPGTTIVDVRTPAEYADGHLPGAMNIDLQGADFLQQVSALDPTAPYAVYCRSGNRSAVAVDQMTQLGFTSAYDLAGGYVDWEQAGGETVTG